MSNDCEREEITPPWNFSWVVQNQLAAMGWPYSEANLRFLITQRVKHLITLSPEKLPPAHKFPEIEWTQIPVEEFEAPTLEQIIKFIQICEMCLSKKEAIGIHCRQGRGRTGVMAACYLVRFQDLAPERAIINLRLQRPGSIETLDQERSVGHYHDHLRKSENASLATEIMNCVYGADTVTASTSNFGFVDSDQAIFMLKMHLAQAAPSSKMPI